VIVFWEFNTVSSSLIFAFWALSSSILALSRRDDIESWDSYRVLMTSSWSSTSYLSAFSKSRPVFSRSALSSVMRSMIFWTIPWSEKFYWLTRATNDITRGAYALPVFRDLNLLSRVAKVVVAVYRRVVLAGSLTSWAIKRRASSHAAIASAVSKDLCPNNSLAAYLSLKAFDCSSALCAIFPSRSAISLVRLSISGVSSLSMRFYATVSAFYAVEMVVS